jgi:hypothetical protein
MDCNTGSGRKPPATHKPQTCRRRAASRLYRTPGTRTGMTSRTAPVQKPCHYIVQDPIKAGFFALILPRTQGRLQRGEADCEDFFNYLSAKFNATRMRALT